MPQGVTNTAWRCGDCGLIHFHCGVCYAQRTIPKAWEVTAIPELRRRTQFSGTGLIICDVCWPVVRAKVIPVAEGTKPPDPEADKIVPAEGIIFGANFG